MANLIFVLTSILGRWRFSRLERRLSRDKNYRMRIGLFLLFAILFWRTAVKYRFGYCYGDWTVMVDGGRIVHHHYLFGASTIVDRWFFEEAHSWGAWWPRSNPLPSSARADSFYIFLSLRIVVAANLALFLIACWRCHSPPLHRCLECDYLLIGNSSGKCSECGSAVAPNQLHILFDKNL